MNSQTIHPEMAVTGPVCPNCYRPLASDGHTELPDLSIGGRRVRAYVGNCDRPGCQISFDVRQFEMNGKWFIHSYQLYKTQPLGGIVIVCPLPKMTGTGQGAEAAPVLLVGPGGDYQRIVEVTEDGLMKTLVKNLHQATDAVAAMLSLRRSKTHQPAGENYLDGHNC